MCSRPGLAVLVALLLAVTPVAAQQNDEVNPDRPGISTGAETVPRGVLQLEAGGEYARERRAGEPSQRRASVVTTLRYGLLDGLELRIDGEPFVALRNGDDATNVGDISLGAKWRLLDGAEGTLRPTISLFPSVKLPTAPDPIGTERADFTLLGLASFGFGRVSLDFNAGVAAIGQRDSDSYLVQALLVAAPSVDVTKGLKVFGEIFYASRAERDGEDLVGATLGATYLLTRDVALDAAVITALAGRGPDYRIQAGVTIKFGP